ncbi:hypothetical protein GGR35_003775 [Mucilaginibacter phyllosphaerae]|uniref:Uncharacterized protein n=1 Tax=Mucilaginibacter phyllosphaerae TaxID=1812349 RepID=A0ABR6IDL2_9SPHI|nr:hypothetical protein [Mucilaginibacter phyllosphaerae]
MLLNFSICTRFVIKGGLEEMMLMRQPLPQQAINPGAGNSA